MKTKSLIYRVGTAAMLSAGFLMSAPLLTSCSSEDTPVVDTPDPEGEATISLSISTPFLATTSTRAGDEDNSNRTPNGDVMSATDEEGAISSIWLYIFRADGTFAEAIPIDPAKTTGATRPSNVNGSGYKTILENKVIAAGDYRFYVVANLDDYCSAINPESYSPVSTTAAENNFKNSILTFSNSATGSKYDLIGKYSLKTLDKKFVLPMGADADDFNTKNTENATKSNDGKGTITIKNGKVELKADMTFLCSAVRYTFLFDNTIQTQDSETGVGTEKTEGFSYPYRDFAPYTLTLSNVYNKSYLLSKDIISGSDIMRTERSIDIKKTANRVKYPENLHSFIDTPSNLEPNPEGWPATSKTAYQGLVYIPENLTSSKTNMVFNAVFDEKYDGSTSTTPTHITPYTIPLPTNETSSDDKDILKRGHFYDIIGKITSTGMAFYVRVKDWDDVKLESFEF